MATAQQPPDTRRGTSDSLLSPDFLRRLERLELVTRKALIGRMKGERRSRRRGQSVEFADYRDYTPGDDLRFLDWNIYGRLDRLFIKLFVEEEDLHFHILIDASKSMDFGTPTKLRFATQIAAALGFVGLIGQDRVVVHLLGEGITRSSRPLRGRRSFIELLEFLERVEPEAEGDLHRSLRQFALTYRIPGIALVLSDFLDKQGYEPALRYLAASPMEVHVVQVLAREELDPPLLGDLRLIDCEDGEELPVTISAPLLQRYRQRLRAFCGGIERWCLAREMSYMLATSDADVESVVFDHFRRIGLVK